MNPILPCVALACVVTASGCTTELNASRVVTGHAVALAGTPYNLPYTRFKLDIVRRVASCDGGIRIDTHVIAVPQQARDPRRSYVIDLESLQGAFKSTDLQVSYYDNGAIKSINGSAEDRTGEFIGSALQTVATLARSAAGVALAEKSARENADACHPDVAKALSGLQGSENRLDAATDEVAQLTEQLRHYSALVATLGRGATAAHRRRLTTLMEQLLAANHEVETQKKTIADLLAKISVKVEKVWPDDGETFVSPAPVAEQLDDKVFRKWMWAGRASSSLAASTAVHLQLRASEGIGRQASCGDACPEDSVSGLKYRIPAAGTLTMCSALVQATRGAPATCGSDAKVVGTGMFSQLGRVYVLPLRSAVFTSKSVVATFTESGLPTSIGTTSGARSDKAAATLAAVAGATADVRDSHARREAVELEDRIKVLTLRKELEIALQDLALPKADPVADATNAFTVDTTLVAAELANLEAKRALAAARQVPGSP